MDRNIKLLEAAMLQLKGKSVEHLAAVEMLVDKGRPSVDSANYVEEILAHMREVMICENTLAAVQMYFPPNTPQATPPVMDAEKPPAAPHGFEKLEEAMEEIAKEKKSPKTSRSRTRKKP
tara:strand:+ start:6661 stop:7020 length:360 start_codon:yes stop_codon:yes gene_type:complete